MWVTGWTWASIPREVGVLVCAELREGTRLLYRDLTTVQRPQRRVCQAGDDVTLARTRWRW